MVKLGKSFNAYLTAGLVAFVASSALAAPASAKDYTPAFPSGADIPANLGTYDAKPMVDAGKAPSGGWYPCSAFTVPSAKTIVTASYADKSGAEKTVEVRSYIYANNAKAKKAFGVIKKKLSSCNGTRDIAFGDSGKNTMRSTTTTGLDANNEITGEISRFVYTSTAPIPGVGDAARDSGGSYSVLILSGNAIMQTTATQVGTVGYTADQKSSVALFASDSDETWSLVPLPPFPRR